MPKLYKNVIFDLDGTLIDSAEDIASCLDKALSEATGNNTGEKLQKTSLGLPLREIVLSVRPGLAEEQLDLVCASFRGHYDSSDYPGTVFLPRVTEILPALLLQGVQLFVATNKPIKPTLRILAKLGMSGWFKEVAAPDSVPARKMSKARMVGHLLDKWGLNRNLTLMVGDTEHDIIAARENKIDIAYLVSGYGGEAPAASHGPDILLADIGALGRAVL